MTFDQSKWIWRNGQFIPWHEATIHVSAHALHYGSGVFEGMRCYETEDGPAVFRLDAHLDRFSKSAEFYGLQIQYEREDLIDAIAELIERNNFSSCYVRPICFFGSNSLSVHPAKCPTEVVLMAWPWAPYLGAVGLTEGVRITVSPWTKFRSDMMPTTVKASGQYINSILAVREAVSRGFDEALLLNSDGNIAEGSGENLFVVRSGRVITNDAGDSILPGITRDAVIEIARALGHQVEVRPLTLSDLLTADEAFFTGTAVEVTPIREVDGQLLNGGVRGPVTHAIQQVFFSAVAGRDERYKHWLHYLALESTTSSGEFNSK